MENGPFKNLFPIENGDIPACYVSLPEGICSPETDLFTLERPITVGTLPETRRGKKRGFNPNQRPLHSLALATKTLQLIIENFHLARPPTNGLRVFLRGGVFGTKKNITWYYCFDIKCILKRLRTLQLA